MASHTTGLVAALVLSSIALVAGVVGTVVGSVAQATKANKTLTTDLQNDINTKVSKTGDSMSGDLNMKGNDFLNVNSISGTTQDVGVNNIVSNTEDHVVEDHIAVFANTTGRIVKDSGFSVADLIPASIVSSVSGTPGNISSTGGLSPIINLVPTGVVAGSYVNASFNIDSFGRIHSASSEPLDVKSDGSPSVAGNLPVYTNTSGLIITDSGFSTTSFLPFTGGVMTGPIDMGDNAITNIHSTGYNDHNIVIGPSAGLVLFSNLNRMHTINSVNTVQDIVYLTDITTDIKSGSVSVTGNFPKYANASGLLLIDSGFSTTSFLPFTGGTMTGPINMGTNAITNASSGTFSGSVKTHSDIAGAAMPASFTMYNSGNVIVVFNTVALTSITSAGPSSNITGVLTIPANTLVNPSQVHISLNFDVRTVAADTISLALYLNGASIVSTTLSPTVALQPGHADWYLEMHGAGIRATESVQMNGVANIVATTTSAWDFTIANTFDLRVQWSAANALNDFNALNARIDLFGAFAA
jgi:hypothetical protein